jgi:hypothetical protein
MYVAHANVLPFLCFQLNLNPNSLPVAALAQPEIGVALGGGGASLTQLRSGKTVTLFKHFLTQTAVSFFPAFLFFEWLAV